VSRAAEAKKIVTVEKKKSAKSKETMKMDAHK
jgi:hypothetical protein